MEKIKFNNGWKVWKDLDPFELVFHVPEDAAEVDLPYDAMFHEEQKQGAAGGGYTGNIDAGEYKYYKRFFVPEEYRGGHVMLQFEGIYRNAGIFVNQSRVGGCAYGYTDFTVEAGDYLRYGEENEVLVTVKCGTRSSRWYSGAGIYRDVWLIRGGETFVQPYGLKFTTLDVDADGALACVSAQIHNDGLAAKTLTVSVHVRDQEGRTAVDQRYPVRINSRSVLDFRKNVYIDGAKLWDEYAPNLYEITLTILEGDTVLDETAVTSG
ncbi:MAG: glycoside hydrolase family 2 protein, partial [Schaedlerella arabinosiphila]|nr:glycoside hydrolase family 2 protein [Schaedlerella arabinosiphila]